MPIPEVAPSVESLATRIGSRLDGSPLAVMLDIDGTLAPIAPRPADAFVPAPTRRVIEALIARPGVLVALVSGRSAMDAWRLAGVTGAWVIGNHGIELRTPEGVLSADPAVQPFVESVATAYQRLLPLERQINGTIVENKHWTLSVHYRLVAREQVALVTGAAEAVARAVGLRVHEGKMIVELRPPVQVDKGTATVAFAERVGALDSDASAFYAGDDRTDEDAFRALRARHAVAVTARIGPTDAGTHAEFRIETPDGLRALLEWLASRRLARRR